MSPDSYLEYLNGEGVRAYEDALEEAMEDQIFGVPLFVIDGQQFWGHDRLWLIEKYLEELGASR